MENKELEYECRLFDAVQTILDGINPEVSTAMLGPLLVKYARASRLPMHTLLELVKSTYLRDESRDASKKSKYAKSEHEN